MKSNTFTQMKMDPSDLTATPELRFALSDQYMGEKRVLGYSFRLNLDVKLPSHLCFIQRIHTAFKLNAANTKQKKKKNYT